MEHYGMIARLATLRIDMEQEAGIEGIESIDVPLPLLLHDVCKYLGLDRKDTQVVLGPQCTAYVQAFMASTATPIVAIPIQLPALATASGQPLLSD